MGALQAWQMTAQEAFQLHGIKDPRGFVGSIIGRHRATGAYLGPEQWKDLEAHLLLELCKLAVQFDPAKNTSLSKYAHTRLPLRIVDYYRRELVDTRYEQPPDLTSIDGSPDGLGLHNRGTTSDYDDSDLRVTILRAA